MKIIKFFGRKLRYLITLRLNRQVLENVNGEKHSKRCLMVYIKAPFEVEPSVSEKHQNFWQSREFARLIGKRGYEVDVADYNNPYVKLNHNYDMVMGLIPRGIDYYSKHLKTNAIRIAYLTSMNLAVTSRNEAKRIAELKERRGFAIVPRRSDAGIIHKEIEQMDAAWFIGNEYNYQSYSCFNMPPVSFIKNNGYVLPWVEEVDVTKRDSKSYLFFASFGQVHKGLDLLLDIFSKPEFLEYTLYICSSFKSENDFCEAYNRELYHTPNIKAIGFVDSLSNVFKEVAQKCTFSIMPSCAEGMAGSVLTAMSAGLIPIVSDVCGFADEEFILLPDCKMSTIERTIMECSGKDAAWMADCSIKAIKCVQEKYSKKNFTESVDAALDKVLKQ